MTVGNRPVRARAAWVPGGMDDRERDNTDYNIVMLTTSSGSVPATQIAGLYEIVHDGEIK